MYVGVSHAYVVVAEIGRGHQIPWNSSFNGNELHTMWVENQRKALCKNSQYSKLRSHLSTPSLPPQQSLPRVTLPAPLPYFLFPPTFLIFMSIDNQAVIQAFLNHQFLVLKAAEESIIKSGIQGSFHSFSMPGFPSAPRFSLLH